MSVRSSRQGEGETTPPGTGSGSRVREFPPPTRARESAGWAGKWAKRGCAHCAQPGLRIGWYWFRTGPDSVCFLEFSVFAGAGMQFESHLGHVFSLFRGWWASKCAHPHGGPWGPLVGGRCCGRRAPYLLCRCFWSVLPLHCRLRSLSWALRRIHASVARWTSIRYGPAEHSPLMAVFAARASVRSATALRAQRGYKRVAAQFSHPCASERR